MSMPITSTAILGKTISKLRKQQNLTQEDLAGLSGVGRRFISELENGKQTVEVGKVFLLLDILGATLQMHARWTEPRS